MRLLVVGEIGAKSFHLTRRPEGNEVGFIATVKVLGVEAGEIA